MKKSPHKDKEFAQCWSCLTKLSRIEVKNHLCPKPSQETSLKVENKCNEEDDYEKKHCPNCKLDFLGIGIDSQCPECETKFVAPSLEWEFDEDMLKNGNDGDTREWKIRQEQIEKEVKSFIHKVESNALAR